MNEEFAAALDAAIFNQASRAARIETAILVAAIRLKGEIAAAGLSNDSSDELADLTHDVGELARMSLAALSPDDEAGSRAILDGAREALAAVARGRRT